MIDQQNLEQLSDEELLIEARKSKKEKTIDSVIIGFLVGIAIYSSVSNGVGLLTFLPLVYVPVIARKRPGQKALAALIAERNLS